jgi:hypothetical protein
MQAKEVFSLAYGRCLLKRLSIAKISISESKKPPFRTWDTACANLRITGKLLNSLSSAFKSR